MQAPMQQQPFADGLAMRVTRHALHRSLAVCRGSKGARPAGDLTALREDIWDAVHDMYRIVRTATADTAWTDEQVDFTGLLRGSHRPESAASATERVDDAPSQLVAGDVMIADMQVEIKALEAKIEANRQFHKSRMAKEATKTWEVESKVREHEKINAFLRQVVMTGQMQPTEVDAINDRAVSNSSTGPEVNGSEQ